MTPAEIQVRVNIAQREADYWRNLLTRKSCHDCKHFPSGGCELAGGIKPPVEVQKVGCGSWEWDSIPFK